MAAGEDSEGEGFVDRHCSVGYTGAWQCDLGAGYCKVENQVTLK